MHDLEILLEIFNPDLSWIWSENSSASRPRCILVFENLKHPVGRGSLGDERGLLQELHAGMEHTWPEDPMARGEGSAVSGRGHRSSPGPRLGPRTWRHVPPRP